ncbi:MAG: peptidoglycan recognition family protein [Raoultibacter sp.]
MGALSMTLALVACAPSAEAPDEKSPTPETQETRVMDTPQPAEVPAQQAQKAEAEVAPTAPISAEDALARAASALTLREDFRASFAHGSKPAQFQKYIMLHDTEGNNDAASVIEWWDSSGAMVAAHFIVNKDGSIVSCAPLDSIVHHAGFGDTGHNAAFGVEDESRDDKTGTTPIGDWAADYGMNSYSVGIELVHVGGSGAYPQEQLNALDALIAYIDAYYGFPSQIIDHKSWRSGNSDTSPEFSNYLFNYQTTRNYQGA